MRDKSGHGTFSGRGPAAIGRPVLLSPGLGYAGGGYASPLDVGGAMDDGKKFRDLVWIPDDEKVQRFAILLFATCDRIRPPPRLLFLPAARNKNLKLSR